RTSPEEIYPHLLPFLSEGRPIYEVLALIELHQKRARTLREMGEKMGFFFAKDDALEYDPEPMKKYLKGDDTAARLSELRDALAATEPFDVAATEQAVRALAE